MTGNVLVEVRRGRIIESRHRGAVAVATCHGELVAFAGDPDLVTSMRSTAKPLQAVSFILSGAAAVLRVSTAELAVVAGSHSGEDIHVHQVASLLQKAHLTKEALQCGAHAVGSWTTESKDDVLQNNCSGKHAAMLAQCVVAGHDLSSYVHPEHAVQQRNRDTVARLAGLAPEALTLAVESCGVPTFALTLRQLAAAFARFAEPVSLDSFTAEACRQVSNSMTRYPELAGGTRGRLCTEIMRAHAGTIVAKVGAEGVFAMAVLPGNDHEIGLGVAVKIEDGNDRAVGPVALETLHQLNLLRDSFALSPWRRPPLTTFSGTAAGELAAVFSLRTSNS